MGQIPGCHGHGQCLTPPPYYSSCGVGADSKYWDIQQGFMKAAHIQSSLNKALHCNSAPCDPHDLGKMYHLTFGQVGNLVKSPNNRPGGLFDFFYEQ